MLVKFIHSEKDTKCCKISTEDLTGTTVEILQSFVAFSEYMKFTVESRFMKESQSKKDCCNTRFLVHKFYDLRKIFLVLLFNLRKKKIQKCEKIGTF